MLTGSTADLVLSVVGPWSRLTDERLSPLRDPDRDLRMTRADLAGDPRVRLVEQVAATAFPATFRMVVPAGWAPGRDTLRRLAREASRRDRGLVSLLLPDGRAARLERTSAFARAARVQGDPGDPGADGPADGHGGLDDVVDRISETWWYDAREEGFTHLLDPPVEAAPTPAEKEAGKGAGKGAAGGSATSRGGPGAGPGAAAGATLTSDATTDPAPGPAAHPDPEPDSDPDRASTATGVRRLAARTPAPRPDGRLR